MRHSVYILLSILTLSAAGEARGQEEARGLTWEQTVMQIETDGSNEAHDVVFRIRNNGPTPDVIRSVNTSCGCTVGTPDKPLYAPGESGTLPVKHNRGPAPARAVTASACRPTRAGDASMSLLCA